MDWDPHFCNIEENIDEFERRIKAEQVRYAKLMANQRLYEQFMDPQEYTLLFREASRRLVDFDPNFSAPETDPLPTPWVTYYQRQQQQRTFWS